MCRLYAVRASHAGDVVGDLLLAEHSLCHQSRRDLTNRDHSDGWGMVSYHGRSVRWVRHVEPAHLDERFAIASRSKRATTVVAHVRRASRGVPKVENCHPFVWSRWTFAHNGTLTAVDSLRERMLQEIDLDLRQEILGETDSELMFYWILQRLADGRTIDGNRCLSLARMRTAIATALTELDQRNQKAEAAMGSNRIAKLNTILTNGSILVGTRLRNSLYKLQIEYPRPGKHQHRAISIASEPTDSRPWQEIPDNTVFSISSSAQFVAASIVS